MFLTVLPWTVRNTLVFHHVVLVSTGGGQLVWLATVPFTGGEWNEHAPHYQQVYRPLVQGLSAVEADRRLAREGLHNIVQRPWEYLRLCLLRVPRLWVSGHSNMMVHLEDSSWNYWVRGQYGQALVKIALLLLNLGVVLLGVLGGYLAFSAGAVDVRQASVLTVPIAVKTMIHTLLFAVARYQIPILPFLMIFAAYACWRVHRVTRALVPGRA